MLFLENFQEDKTMFLANDLSHEEQKVINRVEQYFKSSSMTMQDKLFNALLIAQLELEEQHFSTETEKSRILQFKNVLECVLQKMIR